METCPTTKILDQNGKMMRVNTSELDYYLAKDGYSLADGEKRLEPETDEQLKTEEAAGEEEIDEEIEEI